MIALLLATAIAGSPDLTWDERDQLARAAQVVQDDKCAAVERKFKRKGFWREMGAFVATGLADSRTATATTTTRINGQNYRSTTAVRVSGQSPTLADVAWVNQTPKFLAKKEAALRAEGCL
jgi:hypothetical protein